MDGSGGGDVAWVMEGVEAARGIWSVSMVGVLTGSVGLVSGMDGIGLRWASPMRRRVRVIWLLVGTPRRTLLQLDQILFHGLE